MSIEETADKVDSKIEIAKVLIKRFGKYVVYLLFGLYAAYLMIRQFIL